MAQVIKHPQDTDIAHSLHDIFIHQVDRGGY